MVRMCYQKCSSNHATTPPLWFTQEIQRYDS